MQTYNNNKVYSNCKISNPILHQDAQLVSFNGFAWSNSMGIIHETSTIPQQSWDIWLGTR
jgi:hypothetical protein